MILKFDLNENSSVLWKKLVQKYRKLKRLESEKSFSRLFVQKFWNLEVISRLCTRRLNSYLKTQLIKAQAERILSESKKKSSQDLG